MTSGTLVGVNLILLTTVSIVGVLVGSARWARWLGVGVAGAGLLTALGGVVDHWWWIGVAVSGGSLAAMTGTWLKGMVRERPSAAGPPWQAVGLSLLLLAIPGIIGAASPDGLGVMGWTAAASAFASGILYAKAGPLSLITVRFFLPVLFMIAGLTSGMPEGLVMFGVTFASLMLAWTKPARLAVRPLEERGTTVRMPAELAPPDILEAAGLDDRGHRKGSM